MQKKSLLGLFFVSFLALSFAFPFVVAADPFTQLFGENAHAIFSQWSGGEFNANVTKILLTVIVTILVYAIADKLPGLGGQDKDWLRWGLAIIVGILGTWFIIPVEIYAILVSYSALGFALSAILPFFIMAYWSFAVLSDSDKKIGPSAAKWLVRLVWLFFIGFMIYRVLIVMPSLPQPPASSMYWISWLIILALLIGLLFLNTIQRKIMKEKFEGQQLQVESLTKKAVRMEADQAAMFDLMAEEASRKKK